MTHDPLCLHDGGAYHELGENSCACDLIAKVRADERSLKGACWREAEGSQVPAGAIRVYREAGWFWEMP